MKKRTIGQVLRLSRVNLQLSLQDLSKKTAIEIPYIEALENDEFDLLPSPFYAQIYLKKLSWALGLDESILLTAFREGKELLFDEEILVDDEELHSRKLRQKTTWLPILYYLLVSFAILGFVIYIVYFYEFTASVK